CAGRPRAACGLAVSAAIPGITRRMGRYNGI
ncbi:hypothetical protein ACSTI4_24035, partial [Vibrio parahaemolyticus]